MMFMNLTLISDLVLKICILVDDVNREALRLDGNYYVKDKVKFAVLNQFPEIFL